MPINKQYGGPGEYTLPFTHQAAITVPKGGSCCANCRFVSEDLLRCSSWRYQKWHGDDKLFAPADEMCSDWYEPKDINEQGFSNANA